MINLDQTTSRSTATNTFYSGFCGFKLPCGYCTRLERPCPMQGSGSITWTSSNVSTPNVTLNCNKED